jgi:hypothetical protein
MRGKDEAFIGIARGCFRPFRLDVKGRFEHPDGWGMRIHRAEFFGV